MTEKERKAEERKEQEEQAAREYMAEWRDLAQHAHKVNHFDQMHPVDTLHYMRRAEEYFRCLEKIKNCNPIKDHTTRDYNTQVKNRITREFVELLKQQEKND